MPQTLVEKIAQRFAVGLPAGQTVRAGDFLSIRPAHCMTHDNTDAVIPKFKSIGAKKVHDPRQPVFALDHDIQNKSPENLAKYAKIAAFAKEHGIDFYPAGRGIGHQIMLEEGYVLPGSFVVASDSHSNIYGGLAALGTPVVRTDAAAIWSTGRTWWQVPEIVKVNLRGKLQPGVTGKDVIITLIGVFNKDEVLNCCLEFAGPGVAALSIEERMTIANMTTEWGVLAAVFPYDEVTRKYLLARAEVFKRRGDAEPRLTPDHRRAARDARRRRPTPDAVYAKEIDFDLSAVAPFVAGPNEVKTITSAAEFEAKNVRIDKAFLMSCVNGRLQDFEPGGGGHPRPEGRPARQVLRRGGVERGRGAGQGEGLLAGADGRRRDRPARRVRGVHRPGRGRADRRRGRHLRDEPQFRRAAWARASASLLGQSGASWPLRRWRGRSPLPQSSAISRQPSAGGEAQRAPFASSNAKPLRRRSRSSPASRQSMSGELLLVPKDNLQHRRHLRQGIHLQDAAARGDGPGGDGELRPRVPEPRPDRRHPRRRRSTSAAARRASRRRRP